MKQKTREKIGFEIKPGASESAIGKGLIRQRKRKWKWNNARKTNHVICSRPCFSTSIFLSGNIIHRGIKSFFRSFFYSFIPSFVRGFVPPFIRKLPRINSPPSHRVG